jgi:hypothetical protein
MKSSNTDLRQVDFMNKISLKINYIMKIIATILFFFLTSDYICGQVVIGPGTADPSAQLDVKSTNRGLLPPRMMQVERDDIISPPAGLLIWCTDCGNGKIPDGVSFNNNAIRNVESSGQMQVFNGKTWTDIYGNSALTAEPILTFQKATFPNQSAKILQPCDFKVTLKYQGGNGIMFNTIGTIYSTGVTGLVAVLETPSGTLSRDSGEFILRVKGMPYKYGDANFVINIAQNSFSFNVPISSGGLSYGQSVPIEVAVFDPSTSPVLFDNYFTRSEGAGGPFGAKPKPFILHLLTPGQDGYDPNVQHGYLFMYNLSTASIAGIISKGYLYLSRKFNYNGLEFFPVTYGELKNLFAAKNTNGIKGFVISSSSPNSDPGNYYYLNFNKRSIPLKGSKNYLKEDDHYEYKFDTYSIYRF